MSHRMGWLFYEVRMYFAPVGTEMLVNGWVGEMSRRVANKERA